MGKMRGGVLAEEQFGTGLLDQEKDERDYPFSVDKPFDWRLGFDIELVLGYRATCKDEKEFFGIRGREGWGVDRYKEIVDEVKTKNIKPFRMPIKNQGASSSCTGQALSYYISVLNFIETGMWVEVSARDIYAYISLGEGVGAYLRDALKLVCDRGAGTEELVPCYHRETVNGREFITPYSEKEYLIKPEETEGLKTIRRALKGKQYRLITASAGRERMEQMAWETLLGFGCYFAVDGENNGTWSSEYPKPPVNKQWGHALYNGKVEDTYFSFPNSWGNIGVNGWQKLKDDYFLANCVHSPWVLIDEVNENIINMDNTKFLKDNDKKWVRNSQTGSFGRILQGKLFTFETKDRAVLAILDEMVRQNGIQMSNDEWFNVPKTNF